MKRANVAEAEWDGGPVWLLKRSGFLAPVSTAAPAGAFEPVLRVASGWSRNAIQTSDGTTLVWHKNDHRLLRADRTCVLDITARMGHYDIEFAPELVGDSLRKTARDPKALIFLCLFLCLLEGHDAAVAATIAAIS